jgi:hypothetical protein
MLSAMCLCVWHKPSVGDPQNLCSHGTRWRCRKGGLRLDVVEDIRAINDSAMRAAPRKTGMIILGGGAASKPGGSHERRGNGRLLVKVWVHVLFGE